MKKQLILSAIEATLLSTSAFAFAANSCEITYQQLAQASSQEHGATLPQRLKGCSAIVFAFKKGDQVPVSISGNFLETDPSNTPILTVTKDFWFKMPMGHGNFMFSQDGVHYVIWKKGVSPATGTMFLGKGLALNLNLK